MKTVFNTPVAAAGIEQALGVGAVGFETGNPIDGFGGEFVADQVSRFTANSTDLLSVAEVHISIQIHAGPDVADLQSSMGFIDGGVLRGEKTPTSDRMWNFDVALKDRGSLLTSLPSVQENVWPCTDLALVSRWAQCFSHWFPLRSFTSTTATIMATRSFTRTFWSPKIPYRIQDTRLKDAIRMDTCAGSMFSL